MLPRFVFPSIATALMCVGTSIAGDAASLVAPRIPATVSPEAQRALANPPAPPPATATLEERRRFFYDYQTNFARVQMRKYPVTIESGVIAGVHVRTIKPAGSSRAVSGRILIDLHGGGFLFDSRVVDGKCADCRSHANNGRRGSIPPRARAPLPGGRR